MTTNTPALAAAALLLASAFVGCSSSRSEPDLRLDLDDSSIELAVSSDLARSLLEDALDTPLDCSGDLDPELRSFLAALDRRSRGRATLRNGNSELVGRRRGGRLDLELRGRDGGRLEATLPWAVADCLLGRDITLDEALGRGRRPVEVRVVGADGQRLAASLR
jgi:hypothetical protein